MSLSALRTLFSLPEPEPLDYPFADSDVAQLHRLCADPAAHALDDATWRDLMLDQYRHALSGEVSIVGQQVLYQRLRAGARGVADRVRALLDDPARAAALRQACKPLRRADQEIATLLYQDPLPALPRWAAWTWTLPIALLLSIAAAMLVSPVAWIGAGAVLYFLMMQQMRYGLRVEQWTRSIQTVQLLLRVTAQLGGPDAGEASRLNRALNRSHSSSIPGMRGYQDWFALANVKHYFHTTQLVHAQRPMLRAAMDRVGAIEADLALARHLQDVGAFCWSTRSAGSALALCDMVHPLLPQARPLTLSLGGNGAFISGQNGVGKSTLLRSTGLNLVTACAFGFCYARDARVPDLPVYSSMQNDDSLLGGESLYMAELRRARELMAAAEGPHPGVYLIDEIFRGTNHLESVSAAASVLHVLAQQGLVIVSSHNLVLASLLEDRLDPLCVRRDAGGALVVANGVLAHTNGIALLAEQGFGPGVEANAGKVFDWLHAYLAQPADCKGVLV